MLPPVSPEVRKGVYLYLYLYLHCHLNAYFCPFLLKLSASPHSSIESGIETRKWYFYSTNPDRNWVHLNWESNYFTGVPEKNGILHHACAFFKASYCHYMACECKGMLRSWLSEMCKRLLAPLKKWELLIGSCIKELKEGSVWLHGLSSLFTQILVKVLTNLREEKARVWIIGADAGKLDLNNQSRYPY